MLVSLKMLEIPYLVAPLKKFPSIRCGGGWSVERCEILYANFNQKTEQYVCGGGISFKHLLPLISFQIKGQINLSELTKTHLLWLPKNSFEQA